jgi:hypothetical protein
VKKERKQDRMMGKEKGEEDEEKEKLDCGFTASPGCSLGSLKLRGTVSTCLVDSSLYLMALSTFSQILPAKEAQDRVLLFAHWFIYMKPILFMQE